MSKHDCPPEREAFDSIHLTPLQLRRIATQGCRGTFIRLGTGWVCDCDVCVRADMEFAEPWAEMAMFEMLQEHADNSECSCDPNPEKGLGPCLHCQTVVLIASVKESRS